MVQELTGHQQYRLLEAQVEVVLVTVVEIVQLTVLLELQIQEAAEAPQGGDHLGLLVEQVALAS